MKETRRTRQIRMLDSEWDAFKRLLGTEWLRARIRGAILGEKRRENSDAQGRELEK